MMPKRLLKVSNSWCLIKLFGLRWNDRATPYTKLHVYARTESVRTKYKVNKVATFENHCSRVCEIRTRHSQKMSNLSGISVSSLKDYWGLKSISRIRNYYLSFWRVWGGWYEKWPGEGFAGEEGSLIYVHGSRVIILIYFSSPCASIT